MEKDQRITRDMAFAIENAGVKYVLVYGKTDESHITKVIGNNFVDLEAYVDFDTTDLKVPGKVYYPVLKEILEENEDEKAIKEAIIAKRHELSPKHIIVDDIIASVSYILNLNYGIGNIDDIDHLGNRRLRTVGELLQNQFRIGLARMERVVKERMTIQDIEVTTPQALMNIRPVTAAIKEFLEARSFHSLWIRQTLLLSLRTRGVFRRWDLADCQESVRALKCGMCIIRTTAVCVLSKRLKVLTLDLSARSRHTAR